MDEQQLQKALVAYLRINRVAIAVSTTEQDRAKKVIQKAVYEMEDIYLKKRKESKYNSNVFTWDVIDGLERMPTKKGLETPGTDVLKFPDTHELPQLSKFLSEPDNKKLTTKSIFIMFDVSNLDLTDADNNRAICKLIKLMRGESTIFFVGAHFEWPVEIQSEVTQLELDLPDEKHIRDSVKIIAAETNQIFPLKNIKSLEDEDFMASIVGVSRGLSAVEIENAMMYSAVTTESISTDIIREEKIATIKRSGLLEYQEPNPDGFGAVGGYDRFQQWIMKRKTDFSQHARDFGIDMPKGVMLLGVPGTGKSLSATCVSTVLGLPLVSLDIGQVMEGIVGATERRTRQAIKLIEAVSPCVILMDEIDKAASGSTSSGESDGGVVRRLVGKLLTYMAENSNGSFFIVTCNRTQDLNTEMLRRGRFDEIFFFDTPNPEARKEIFDIHLRRVNRNPEDYDVKELVFKSKGFVGSEIKSLIQDALHEAYPNKLTTDHILNVMKNTKPLSVIKSEEIEAMRRDGQEFTSASSKTGADEFEKAMVEEEGGSKHKIV